MRVPGVGVGGDRVYGPRDRNTPPPVLPKLTMSRADVVFHGHFYQPPRENPWTDEVEREWSAEPFHDWNARIHHECYAANAASRIYDRDGKLESILNNYEWMSFNFGPTLLRWMERHDRRSRFERLKAEIPRTTGWEAVVHESSCVFASVFAEAPGMSFTGRAGTPNTVELVGTFFTTTEFAPITTSSATSRCPAAL